MTRIRSTHRGPHQNGPSRRYINFLARFNAGGQIASGIVIGIFSTQFVVRRTSYITSVCHSNLWDVLAQITLPYIVTLELLKVA